MRTAVVLPVKTLARAKQRLSGALEAEERRTLAAEMLADVLTALAGAREVHQLLVVTADPHAAAAARLAGAGVIADPDERGQSEAAAVGVAVAEQRGAQRALLVAGDCPLMERGEIEQLLTLPPAPAPRMVIVADRAGRGTNALLLEPPAALSPAFGPGSFARHLARASEAGLLVQSPELPSLALDVDTADDLAALRAVLRADPARAPRTAAFLERLAPSLPAAG